MKQNIKKIAFQLYFSLQGLTILVFFLFGLVACAITSPSDTNVKTVSDAEPAPTSLKISKKPEQPTSTEQLGKLNVDAITTNFIKNGFHMASSAESIGPSTVTESVNIIESCMNEPYSQYEKQARVSIAKGLDATMAGKYGIGFRNTTEHKKWNDTHNKLFKSVSKACGELSRCAKQHPKDKTTECAKQATLFKQWQDMAERFTSNAKLSETTQPPKICSFAPDLDDSADCFHGLADNIDTLCNSANCKAVSDCWRGIGFLDYAISQASSACGFAQKSLTECRGYVTARQRRTNKFQRCNAMQKQVAISALPSL